MAKDGCVLDGRVAVAMQGSNIMKPWQVAVVALVLLAVAGCRSDPNAVLRERQLRLQEDEIYRLRDTIRDLQECPQRDDRPARPSRSSDADREEGSGRKRSDSPVRDEPRPPAMELPSTPSEGVPDTLKSNSGPLPPDVPEVPENLRGPTKPSGASMEGPMFERPAGDVSARSPRATTISQSSQAEAGSAFTPSGNSRQVVSIALDRALTGGVNSGERAGDQGLLVVVEPRDRAGRTVDAPADVSVVLLDPAQRDEEGMAACAARWDFSAAETAAMFRSAGSHRAMHLMMTWPGEPPKHGKLQLFVRYVTRDGRKVEANQTIEVALVGQLSTRWDPADAPLRSDHFGTMRGENVPEPTPQMATRLAPSRPVWSPQRQ
jgi:hypothetical protein